MQRPREVSTFTQKEPNRNQEYDTLLIAKKQSPLPLLPYHCPLSRANSVSEKEKSYQSLGLSAGPHASLRAAVHLLYRHPSRHGSLSHEVRVALHHRRPQGGGGGRDGIESFCFFKGVVLMMLVRLSGSVQSKYFCSFSGFLTSCSS